MGAFLPAQNLLPPARAASSGLQTSALAGGLTSVAGVHLHYHHAARQAGDRVAVQLQIWQQQSGHWPENLAEASMQQVKKWSALYLRKSGEPRLFYGVSCFPFDMWRYGFAQGRWRHEAR